MKPLPSVGDVVIFLPKQDDEKARVNQSGSIEVGIPAIVTADWGSNMVNLIVFPDTGTPVSRISVQARKKGSLIEHDWSCDQWCWPYEWDKFTE